MLWIFLGSKGYRTDGLLKLESSLWEWDLGRALLLLWMSRFHSRQYDFTFQHVFLVDLSEYRCANFGERHTKLGRRAHCGFGRWNWPYASAVKQ